MRIRDVTAMLLFLVIRGSAVPASTLTLDQALEKALTNNKEIQVKRLAIKTAESERIKARLWSQANPELEAEVTSDVLTANSGEGTVQLGVGQEIELGGKRGHRTDIADAHIELAKLELTASEQMLRRDVRAAFYSLILAQQRLSFTQFVDSMTASLRDTAEIRAKSGVIPKSEFTFLNLDLAATRTNVNKAISELNQAQNQLIPLLGGMSDNDIEAVGEIDYQPLNVTEDSLISFASAHRPELQENRLHQSATTGELALARSERVPNLKVSAFYSRQQSVFSSNNFIGNAGGIKGLKDADNLFCIRLSLPLPLIDKHRSEIARFGSEMEVNTASSQSLDVQIRYEARLAYRALKSSEKSLELLGQVQPESDTLFQLLQNAYAQGRVTVSEYLTQKDRLLDMRRNLLDAYSSYVSARKACERATGLDWDQLRRGELK